MTVTEPRQPNGGRYIVVETQRLTNGVPTMKNPIAATRPSFHHLFVGPQRFIVYRI